MLENFDLPPNKYEAARLILCRHLKETASKKGITQEQLAEATGFTQSNIARMLSGKYSPSLDNFMKLAEAVGCFFFISDKEAGDDLTELMRNRYRQNSSDN